MKGLINVFRDDNGVHHASYWWREYQSADGPIVDVITNCNYAPYPLKRSDALLQGIVTCVRCLSLKPPNLELMREVQRGRT